jgi:L-malate glycosyltransferase
VPVKESRDILEGPRSIFRSLLPGNLTVALLEKLGSAAGRLMPRKKGRALFFFFPSYQVGGAEKVHAEVVACVADCRPWLFFVYKSKDEKFKSLFEKHGRLFDLSSLINNRYAYYVCLGALKTFINRHERAVVFGSNNLFFYDLLPRLKKSVRRIDLLHNFGGGIEQVSLPFVHEIDTRVICIRRTFADLREQYDERGVDPQFSDRIKLIELQVRVPDAYPEKHENEPLKVLYVGRATVEKRVHLVAEAARRCHRMNIAAEFTFVGDAMSALEKQRHDGCIFKGEIAEREALDELYNLADVLVLTSVYEGTSLVVMEAMAHGAVPVSTDVGGIAVHVRHGASGILIANGEEEKIVRDLVEAIELLARDRALLKQMSHSAYLYARQHFAPSKFCAAYRQLLLEENPKTEQRPEEF